MTLPVIFLGTTPPWWLPTRDDWRELFYAAGICGVLVLIAVLVVVGMLEWGARKERRARR